jgi:hypothetical protein
MLGERRLSFALIPHEPMACESAFPKHLQKQMAMQVLVVNGPQSTISAFVLPAVQEQSFAQLLGSDS